MSNGPGSPARYRISELVDIPHIQALAEANFHASGLPMTMVDAVDDKILVRAGWPGMCQNFHRLQPEACERCEESDKYLNLHVGESESIQYKCKNGLWHIGIPIRVECRHLATLFMTQFFFEGESIDREYFIRQGELFGFDVDAYLAALDKLPVFSEQRISYALAFYKVMARFIVEMAEQSLKVIRAKDSLQEKEAYTSFVHNVNIGVYRIALPDRFIHVNRTMAAIFGYESPEELLRHPISDLYVDNKERRSIFEELGKTGTVSDHFLAMKKKDGSIIWASLTARAEYDQNGAMQWVDGVIEDVTQRKKADDELRSFSEIDALTGIFNRRKLNDQLRAETRKARRYGRPLSIIFFDIDHFKRTNDSFGHDVGDQVLQVTVDLVRQRLRQDDLFARYGGDEFVILCPETELEGACALAENIRSSIAQREYSWGGKVTVSAGVVQYDACDLSADAALRRADDALYRAKDEGRNRVKAGIR